MPIRLCPDQRLHDLLHERPYALAAIGKQTFPKALSGPKLPFGHRVLQVGGFDAINLPDSVANLLQQALKPDLQKPLYTTTPDRSYSLALRE